MRATLFSFAALTLLGLSSASADQAMVRRRRSFFSLSQGLAKPDASGDAAFDIDLDAEGALKINGTKL